MRARGRDILELFGYRPDDNSETAKSITRFEICPFTSSQCTKTNHDQSIIYGVCSVSYGVKKEEGTEVIICPQRLYSNNYRILQDVIEIVWPNEESDLVIGGSLAELLEKAKAVQNPAVAFGHNSGAEIQIQSNGSLSMDWIIQSYHSQGDFAPKQFVGVEVQSIDITGNYRKNREAYIALRCGAELQTVPDSGHGLNWANVHKRLIPQLIRKGNIYRHCKRCAGFFFLVPEVVFRKFEEVIGNIDEVDRVGNDVLSVITYGLGPEKGDGETREVIKKRVINYRLEDVALSFVTNFSPEAPKKLDEILSSLLA